MQEQDPQKETKAQLNRDNAPQILIMVLLFVGGFFFIFWKAQTAFLSTPRDVVEIISKPIIRHAALKPAVPNGPYMLYDLPLELGRAEIHDIVMDGAVKWLGTDKGLVKIEGDKLTQYQQFSDWPFEWAQKLARSPRGIFVEVYVAKGNTGGHLAGHYLFDTKTESWTEIGQHTVKDQVWAQGALYVAKGQLIRYRAENNWQAEPLIDLCEKRGALISMKHIDGMLWVAGEGYNRACGITKYHLETGDRVDYGLRDGVMHEKGRQIDGDAKGVFVAHSVNYNRMSYFDMAEDKWQRFPRLGSGNTIMVTPSDVWLAVGSPRKPLNRIARDGQSGELYPPFNDRENTYISAMADEGDKIWFGTYIKHWRAGSYKVTSQLGYMPY